MRGEETKRQNQENKHKKVSKEKHNEVQVQWRFLPLHPRDFYPPFSSEFLILLPIRSDAYSTLSRPAKMLLFMFQKLAPNLLWIGDYQL
jgi:hypothetical protein